MLDARVTQVLDAFGVSKDTQAGIDLFGSVPPPQDFDGAFADSTPATGLTLTVGQTTLLRGAIRHVANSVIGEAHQALSFAQALGAEPTSFLEGPPLDQTFRSILALEEALAKAYADAQPGDVTVPDSLPDGWND